MSSVTEGDCPAGCPQDNRARSGTARLPGEVWVLVVANAVIALGYGVVSPVLPQYARHFGVSISAATFVITAFALLRLCSAPPSGLLVQKLGERRVYITGLLIVALSTGACAFATTYEQLLIFRSLGGLGSAMFSVSSLGLMIRISPPDARGRVAGLYASGFLVGSVGGPVLGSLSAGLGLAAPFLIYGVALLVAAAVVFFSLRRSALAAPAARDELVVTVWVALRHRAYRSALFSNFATGWSVMGLRTALMPLFVTEVLARGPAMAGVALSTFAVGNVSAVVPSGRLSDRVGRRALLISGLLVAGVATVWVGFASSLALFLVGTFVAGVASGMFTSPQQAAVADVIGNRASGGTAVATFQMMADLGAIAGSMAVGEMAQHLSFAWAYSASGAILLSAALMWVFAPETRDAVRYRPVPVQPSDPDPTE